MEISWRAAGAGTFLLSVSDTFEMLEQKPTATLFQHRQLVPPKDRHRFPLSYGAIQCEKGVKTSVTINKLTKIQNKNQRLCIIFILPRWLLVWIESTQKGIRIMAARCFYHRGYGHMADFVQK